MKRLTAIVAIPALVLLDLGVKEWAQSVIPPGQYIRGWSGFGLTNIFNPGISFSIFSDNPTAVLVLTAIMTFCIVGWFALTRQKSSIVPLGLVAAGGIANFIDRLNHGAVSDIFVFGPPQAPLFTNNLADFWISFGVVALLIDAVQIRRKGTAAQGA